MVATRSYTLPTRQHSSSTILLTNLGQLGVILHEEVEVLPWHIYFQVGALRPVLL